MKHKIVIIIYILIILNLIYKNTVIADNINELFEEHKFEIYDATKYKNKPNLSLIGIKNIEIIYERKFWPHTSDNRNTLPEIEYVKQLALSQKVKNQMIVLDIEIWPVQGYPSKPGVIKESIDKYVTLFNWFKNARPDLIVGYFSRPPVSNYKASISSKTSIEYKNWNEDNDKLRPIANIVDVAFPSVYTYEEDLDNWKKSFDSKIEQVSKIFNGPIYVFLWPQYHERSIEELRLKFLPHNIWREQLNYSLNKVDGIIIWGGWDSKNHKPAEWDPNASWWLETKDFVSRLYNQNDYK